MTQCSVVQCNQPAAWTACLPLDHQSYLCYFCDEHIKYHPMYKVMLREMQRIADSAAEYRLELLKEKERKL